MFTTRSLDIAIADNNKYYYIGQKTSGMDWINKLSFSTISEKNRDRIVELAEERNRLLLHCSEMSGYSSTETTATKQIMEQIDYIEKEMIDCGAIFFEGDESIEVERLLCSDNRFCPPDTETIDWCGCESSINY